MKRPDFEPDDTRDGDLSVSRIGVLLSVILTVIVATILGTFVLGFDQKPDTNPPKATFEVVFSNDDRTLTIIHRGGDTIDSDRLVITGTVAFTAPVVRIDETRNATWTEIAGKRVNVTEGSSVQIIRPANPWRPSIDFEGETIRIVWYPPTGADPIPIAEVDG